VQFENLLEEVGYQVDLIPLDAIPTTNFDDYRGILVGNDTGSDGIWGDSGGEQAALLAASGLPTLGIGIGGASFFGLMDLAIGWDNTVIDDGTRVTVVDPDSQVWNAPYNIPIPDDRNLNLFSQRSNVIAANLEAVPSGVQPIASRPDIATRYPIARQGDLYLLWGFSEGPNRMTAEGQRAFINILEFLLP
jgi:hypothetical protein